MSRWIKTLYVGIPLACFLSGCSEDPDHQITASEPVLTQQVRQDSITVIISVSETNTATTGKVQLMLDVHTPDDTVVVFPDIGPLVEPFSIAGSYTEPQQTLSNGKVLHRIVWQLVPHLPGKVVFKPLEVSAGATTITTDPIAISVRSILPEGLEDFSIKDIAASATLLPEQEQKKRLGLILSGLAIATSLIIAGTRFNRKSKPVVAVPPHESAFRSLEKLLTDNLEPIPYIQEINHILRSYMNGRFNIPALESTSREIASMLDHPELAQFLSDCDHIKFAHAVPAGFTDTALEFVRSYIEDTKEEDPCD